MVPSNKLNQGPQTTKVIPIGQDKKVNRKGKGVKPPEKGKKNLVEVRYSLEQYIGLKEDKLSSTTVDFIRSEGNLETKCLYWFSKPKMC